MSLHHTFSVGTTAARMGAKRVLSDPLTLVAQFFTYALIIVMYSAFYRSIAPEALIARHLTAADMVWYIGGTEWPLFCFTGYLAKSFQYDLQSGAYESALLRPTPGWIVTVSGWFGAGLMAATLLSLPCFFVTGYMAGGWEIPAIKLLGMCVSLGLAGVLFSTAAFMIGASCLWIQQAEPLIWIFYKSTFLFGALTWPFIFFPPAMAKLASFTPFPSLLAVIGNWTQKESLGVLLGGVGIQLFWCCLFVGGAALIDRAVLRRFQRDPS